MWARIERAEDGKKGEEMETPNLGNLFKKCSCECDDSESRGDLCFLDGKAILSLCKKALLSPLFSSQTILFRHVPISILFTVLSNFSVTLRKSLSFIQSKANGNHRRLP